MSIGPAGDTATRPAGFSTTFGPVLEKAVHRAEDEIQKITDKAVKDIDDVAKAKESELLAV